MVALNCASLLRHICVWLYITTLYEIQRSKMLGKILSPAPTLVQKKILQKDLTSENWIKYYQGPETHTTILRVGAMGSGKTTAVDHFIRDILGYNPALFSLVSLDDMITKSQHYVDEVHNKSLTSAQMDKIWTDTEKKIGGYALMSRIVERILLTKRCFSTEGTGRYLCPSKISMVRAHKQGYDVIVILPYVPFYILKSRVKARALIEKRDVSAENLQDNVLSLLKRMLKLPQFCDTMYILDNTVDPGKTPLQLVKITYDVTKLDDCACTKWTYDFNRISQLLTLLEQNTAEYITPQEISILNEERKILTFLKQGKSMGYDNN